MRTISFAIAAGMAAALTTVGAQAQDAPPPHVLSPPPELSPPPPPDAPAVQTPSRYGFSRVDGGFVRLDSVSGQVAICSQRAVGWACQAVPEERAAFENEIARLQTDVAGLKAEIAALREPPPPRPPADLAPRAESHADTGTLKLPTDEDIKQARAAVEKAWRRLIDMIVGLRNDWMKRG